MSSQVDSIIIGAHTSYALTQRILEKMSETPFLSLAMDLPSAPLYRDDKLQNIIPQVPLAQLLAKYNGTSEKVGIHVTSCIVPSCKDRGWVQEYKTYNDNFTKRFEITHLPEYLLVTYNRFQKNQWFVEKNPTIVNFPIRSGNRLPSIHINPFTRF